LNKKVDYNLEMANLEKKSHNLKDEILMDHEELEEIFNEYADESEDENY
jgi:hypothetical protein